MSLETILDTLEQKYYAELGENKAVMSKELTRIYKEISGQEPLREAFLTQVMHRFGGMYTPYVLWFRLSDFFRNEETRAKVHEVLDAFCDSEFEEEETKKAKPLIITYFSKEKEFEVDRLKLLLLPKKHPKVQEYFEKLLNFVERNKSSVDMYIEKFIMLHDRMPDFDLLAVPVTKLKEKLAAQ